MVPTLRTLLVCALLGVGGSACGALPPVESPATKPMPLVAREGELAAWFDDGIDSSALGLSMDGRSPAADPSLPPRTRDAELVAPVVVSTITRDGNGERTRYLLAVRLAGPVHKRRGLDGDTFELRLLEGGAAFGLMSLHESTFRGARLMLFARRFLGAEGPELHWHLGVDTADVASAIQLAKDLDADSE